jgi:DNA-binding NarL/FixJ family response regulator
MHHLASISVIRHARSKNYLFIGIGVTLNRTRLLLAEDHAAMRNVAMRLLEQEFEVVGTAGDGQTLIEAAARLLPEVLVVDISMPGLSGIEAAHRLRETGSTTKVVFLTVYEDLDYVTAALATGALGYVVKSRMGTDLCLAIKEALAGRLFISPPVGCGPEKSGEEANP